MLKGLASIKREPNIYVPQRDRVIISYPPQAWVTVLFWRWVSCYLIAILWSDTVPCPFYSLGGLLITT